MALAIVVRDDVDSSDDAGVLDACVVHLRDFGFFPLCLFLSPSPNNDTLEASIRILVRRLSRAGVACFPSSSGAFLLSASYL